MKSHLSGIEHIGKRLRSVRIQKNLTLEQLGLLVGTTYQTIQRIENGTALSPKDIMAIAETLDVNPAWLQFGEPYASREWPAEVPKKRVRHEVALILQLADQLIESANKGQLAETARLLALNLAHYQIRFGETPLENYEKLMAIQEMDYETARLVAVGMENLIGVLGLVTTQDEAANDIQH